MSVFEIFCWVFASLHVLLSLAITEHCCFTKRALRPQPTLPQPGLYTLCVKLVTAGQKAELIAIMEGVQANAAGVAIAVTWAV